MFSHDALNQKQQGQQWIEACLFVLFEIPRKSAEFAECTEVGSQQLLKPLMIKLICCAWKEKDKS